MNYRAVESFEGWRVEASLMCINGLSAWFTIATTHDPSEQEDGYSEGAIGSAQERAERIADALNKLK